MIERVYWHGRSPSAAAAAAPLAGAITADVVVVGGGMAGLAAAQWLREEAGREVVLLEAHRCGGGATGRSSGFITPDSELQVADLVRHLGRDGARRLWLAARGACEKIRRDVERYAIECDLVPADCLYLGAGRRGLAAIREEHALRTELGLESRLEEGPALGAVLGSSRYAGGLRYGDTFAIDGHAYAQGMAAALAARGVRVFEGTPVTAIGAGRVETSQGSVTARHVVVCLDRFAPELGVARGSWHAQTFLVVSEPLSPAQRRALFPDGPLLAWDTDLIYQYFRLTGDGRLLVGGGALHETYARTQHGSRTPARLERWARKTFPALRGLRFECYWPGLIGVTRDFLPLAGPSPGAPAGNVEAGCAAGLPWSVLAGHAAARAIASTAAEVDQHFAPDRPSGTARLSAIIPVPATFALSHLRMKYFPPRTTRK